jgi:hypothetical protein
MSTSLRPLVLLSFFVSFACGGDDGPPGTGEPCTLDEHCLDTHECTIDSCGVDGFCRHAPVDAICGEGVCDPERGCVSDLDGGTRTDGAVDDGGGTSTDGGGTESDGGTGTDGGGTESDGGTGTDGGMTGSCTDGARRCSGASVEVCEGGAFVLDEMCAIDCRAGACVTSVTCTPSAYRCNGRGVEVCNSSGSAWLFVQTCATGCEAGLCVGACEPGEQRCNGDRVERCSAEGTAWSAVETCSTFCAYGTCALDGLDVAADTELDGDVWVDGDVLVRSGATLRSPSGDLTLRARTITVQAGGSIAVAATGFGTEGAGENGFFCRDGFNGGTGGGYGTAGTRGPVGSRGVPCSSPGSAFGSGTDSEVARGGPGGAVNGSASPRSPGGGRLRLLATTRVEIAGQITANGVPGVYSEGSSGLSTGGGAGGGVLVAANEVVVSGAITALGGGTSGTYGGTGGQGRIKILSGATRTITGTLTGTVTQGFSPPLEPRSSTHPSTSLFYNDDFASVSVSWERAFPSRLGYYWLVDRNVYRVPTPAIGTFVDAEAISFSRDALMAGDNYFHVAPVNAASEVGSVETRIRVRLNTTPPPVSSSSHPSESAWSTNRDAFFSWALPNGAENYVGVHYVLDRYGDTVPTTADTFLPVSQTTLLRSGLADGVWVLHVVAEDTRGYLTRAAGHRQVRIGADPGVGGLVGQVVDASSSAPIPNARVRVNRGIVPNQTTNATGNYNFMNVPAGTWEIDVSADGYTSMTRSVTVGAGMSVPLNLSLARR